MSSNPVNTPPEKPASFPYCRIIDAYTAAYAKLTKELTHANRQYHADLIDNKLANYICKLYGTRHFTDGEAFTLLKSLGHQNDATAISDYVVMRTALPLLIEKLNLPMSLLHTMTSMPRGQFRRRLQRPDLWQPQEIAELLARLETYSQILSQFLLDPAGAKGKTAEKVTVS